MQGSKSFSRAALLLAAAVLPFGSVLAGVSTVGVDAGLLHAGQLDVPLNKSAVLKSDRAFTKAMVGNADIADVMPLTNKSLYVLGKRAGTTTLMLYQGNSLISVVDVTVGPDVVSLRRQLGELMPNEKVSVRVSNDSVVLSGVLSSAPAVERAMKIAATFAADKVVNMLSVGASQQVMLEVRFSEVSRSVAKDIGLNHSYVGKKTYGSVGSVAPQSIGATKATLPSSPTSTTTTETVTSTFPGVNGTTTTTIGTISGSFASPQVSTNLLTDAFGIGTVAYSLGSLKLFSALDALERKGLVKTLAEPNLVALSGETASFLAGGEFPIPVSQSGTSGSSSNTITVEFKPFGVGLGFTPTVLEDGVINLVVEPEVSSIDPSASVAINGLVVPGLQTRRAKTTVELRDGQSFAIAGLLRNDFNDTIRQVPILGSLPIIGALFRSTGFEKGETELVIIVTPRLVKPMRPEDVHLPTDRVGNPGELDLFLMGRTDKAIGVDPLNPNAPPPEKPTGAAKPPAPAAPTGAQPGMDGPVGHEI